MSRRITRRLIHTMTVGIALALALCALVPRTVQAEPSAPTLKVVSAATSEGGSALQWTSVSGAWRYQVYRSPTSSGNWTRVRQTSSSKTSWSDPTPGTYYYKVRAIDSSGTAGAFSKSVRGFCSPSSSISGTFDGQPVLSWRAVGGAAKYQVWRSATKTGGYSKIGTTVSKLLLIDTSATLGKTYYYKVRAVDKNGVYGPFSTVRSRKAVEVDNTKPNIECFYDSGYDDEHDYDVNCTDVMWTSVDCAVGYQVYCKQRGGSWSRISTFTASECVSDMYYGYDCGTSYYDLGYGEYYYKVRAIDAAGNTGTMSDPEWVEVW